MRLAFSLVVQAPFKAGRGSRCLIALPRIGTPRLSADNYSVVRCLRVTSRFMTLKRVRSQLLRSSWTSLRAQNCGLPSSDDLLGTAPRSLLHNLYEAVLWVCLMMALPLTAYPPPCPSIHTSYLFPFTLSFRTQTFNSSPAYRGARFL
jgi:hypothetical protein